MAFVAYARAILGCLVLEGLRAGVWQGVQHGAQTFVADVHQPLSASAQPAEEAICASPALCACRSSMARGIPGLCPKSHGGMSLCTRRARVIALLAWPARREDSCLSEPAYLSAICAESVRTSIGCEPFCCASRESTPWWTRCSIIWALLPYMSDSPWQDLLGIATWRSSTSSMRRDRWKQAPPLYTFVHGGAHSSMIQTVKKSGSVSPSMKQRPWRILETGAAGATDGEQCREQAASGPRDAGGSSHGALLGPPGADGRASERGGALQTLVTTTGGRWWRPPEGTSTRIGPCPSRGRSSGYGPSCCSWTGHRSRAAAGESRRTGSLSRCWGSWQHAESARRTKDGGGGDGDDKKGRGKGGQSDVLVSGEQQLFIGKHKEYGNVMISPELLAYGAQEAEKEVSVMKQERKAREERALARKDI